LLRVAKLWSALDPIFESDAKEAQKRSDSFLRSGVQSQHATVLVIAKEVSAVNQSGLEEGERESLPYCAISKPIAGRHRVRLWLGPDPGQRDDCLHIAPGEASGGEISESLQAQRELKKLSKRLVDAQEQERRAISRELHDEVGQSLSALLMDVERLSAIPAKMARTSTPSKHQDTAKLGHRSAELGAAAAPSMLDDLGLVAALEWQAREVPAHGNAGGSVEENVSDSLPEEHKTCVYRIVQEALNNCSKHAYAKHVQVTICQKPGRLSLTIQDDGKGFDPVRARGLGLVGMTSVSAN